MGSNHQYELILIKQLSFTAKTTYYHYHYPDSKKRSVFLSGPGNKTASPQCKVERLEDTSCDLIGSRNVEAFAVCGSVQDVQVDSETRFPDPLRRQSASGM